MLNIIKLAVGIEDVDHLSAIQQGRLADEKARRGKDARLFHTGREMHLDNLKNCSKVDPCIG